MKVRPRSSGVSVCNPPRGRLEIPARMTAVLSLRRAAWLLVPSLLLAGCEKPKITSYRVPKEQTAPKSSPHGHDAATIPSRPRPKVEWDLPSGWKEIESRVGLATFAIVGEAGAQAQVNVTPLPPMSGKEALIINMWRSQVGQAELNEADAARQLTSVEVGGETGKMFEVAGKSDGRDKPQRIITAMVHHPDASWFYKIAGDDAVVIAEKPKFLEFLKSIRIKEVPVTEAAAVESEAPSSFNWKVPPDWKSIAPGQMQNAKFSVPANGAARAEVSVSIFGTDTGGTAGNITRWRRQIGLPDVSEAEAVNLAKPLDPHLAGAMLLDMTNAGKRLVGAIVPRGGKWYFYKLLGDEAAVAPQKDAFVAFVKSEP